MIGVANISMLVILLILCLNIGISEDHNAQYLLFIVLVALAVFRALGRRRVIMPRMTFFDFIPLMFLMIWSYGVTMGVVHENPWEGIIRNFAGMTIYLVYYIFLYLRIPREKIFRTVYWGAIANIFVALAFSFSFYRELQAGNINLPQLIDWGGSTAVRQYYSLGLETGFVVISTLGVSFLCSKETYLKYFGRSEIPLGESPMARMLLLPLGIYASVIVPAARGYWLSFIFLAFAIPFLLSFKSLRFIRLSPQSIILALFLIPLLAFYSSSGALDLVRNMFSGEQFQNVTRYTQFEYMSQELSFFGKGLGAGLDSGYTRDALGYGFELNYVNLAHKFGVFSLVLVSLYGYTLYRIVANIFAGRNLKYSAAALGAMCYLFPSIGNPVLFAPVSSILHCAALYWIREN